MNQFLKYRLMKHLQIYHLDPPRFNHGISLIYEDHQLQLYEEVLPLILKESDFFQENGFTKYCRICKKVKIIKEFQLLTLKANKH